jgi:5'-deoxynucleotidase YfbR-like HD superfamily hydrolase
VLELLAIHDIGEIRTGDQITFTKKQGDTSEAKAALDLLNEKHHILYQEYIEQETKESKFAKSIDKISPDIYDVILDTDLTAKRLKYFANIEYDDIVDIVEKFKAPFMEWNEFFKNFHAELIKKLRKKFNNN